MNTVSYSAASFFSGIGAMDLAAISGFCGRLDIRLLCEIDPYRRSVLESLRHLWPNAKIKQDIRDVNPKECFWLDLMYGGFPCTDISNAGAGKGLQGQESSLWFEFARIIGEARPRCLVLENVPAIAVRGGVTVVAQLASMGYDGIWVNVPAYAFGSPQYRFRWVYVGYSDPERQPLSERENRLRDPQIRDYQTKQRLSQPASAKPTCQSGRTGTRPGDYRRTQSPVGRNTPGIATRMDITLHQFPAGSWQNQKPGEPARLAPPDDNWVAQIEALGDCVPPQQLLPFFEAVYEFLRMT